MLVFVVGCSGTPEITVKNENIFSSKPPKLLSLEPKNNAKSSKRDATIVLNFNQSMDPLTLTVNSKDSQCSGTIQISTNNFSNCVRMNPPELKAGGTKILVSPSAIFAAQKYHQVRLTTKIKTANGLTLKRNITVKPGFKTTWSQQIGTSGEDAGLAVFVDSKGHIYLTGHTSDGKSEATSDLFLAKYSANGSLNWIQQPSFGHPVAAAVMQKNKSGNLSLSAFSQGINSSAVILVSYTKDGKKLFSKVIKFPARASGIGIAMDQDNHIYIPAAVPYNLMKIRKTGEIVWTTELSQKLKLQAIAADTENALFLTGNINHALDGNVSKGGADIFLMRISQMGPKRWSRTIGTPQNESGTALAVRTDGVLAIAGYLPQTKKYTENSSEDRDAFVAKFSSKGRQQWLHVFKGTKSEQSTVVLWTPEGGLLVAGYTESSLTEQSHFGQEDAFLAKLDSAGELLWLQQFGTAENDRALGLALGAKGQIYITGFTEGRLDGAKHSGGKDIFLVQFSKDGEKQ
ncbi:MAG: Ig-like domain-containing protein [SAR324 cluster bacterium]|nr:Ig-like domain-containing protein [SAR324 cluster bacterium]MBL7035032.1 Ig-like domain-containing protein [SAR324 cluster bacterium]